MAPDIPAAKRAGLGVDLSRLAAQGDGWLTPEDRYTLKTHGVCAQAQDHVFMIRVRIPGGVLPTAQARGLARMALRYSSDWLHLSTRQNVELHWVEDRRVPEALDKLAHLGLTTRSACGHTMRNVMASEEAGVGLDEPFDCFADARAVSDAILARSAALNCRLPSRVNLAFGGTPRCRHDALLNDGGFVSVLRDDEPGYELWGGGSLGKNPSLAVPLADFVPRTDVVAAAEALIDVFVDHGDFEHPAKGRLKFAVERLGPDGFRSAWEAAFASARRRPHTPPVPIEMPAETDRVAILAELPPGGWSAGVRPQRTKGLAYLTVDVPLGDLYGADVSMLSDLADRYGDGTLTLSRDQNVVLRHIPVPAVAQVRSALRDRGLYLLGEAHVASVRACTGSTVSALGITRAPDVGRALVGEPVARSQLVAPGAHLGVPELMRPAPGRRHRPGRLEGAGRWSHPRRLPGVPRRRPRRAASRRGRRPGRRGGCACGGGRDHRRVGVTARRRGDARPDREPSRCRGVRRAHRRGDARPLGARTRTDGRRPAPAPPRVDRRPGEGSRVTGSLTHCPYCALNCGLALRTEAGAVTGYDRWKQSPLTEGGLCSKGVTAWKQVHHPDRLLRPLVRRDGQLVETGWEEALDHAAAGFQRVRERLGPEGNAVLGGGSLTNEKAYLVGKFARLALQTPHVDLNGRMCMSAAGAAATRAFGLDRAMTPLSDLAHTHVVIVIGANVDATFPVVIPKALEKVRRRGGRVIVVDPRAGRFVSAADLHLALRPGTDAIVANGLLHAVASLGLVDERFVSERTVGFGDALEAAEPWTPARVEAASGVAATDLLEAASLLGQAERAMILHARGAEQQVSGTQNVLAYINVALACGHAGRRGSGIVTLTGQRNGQGGREHGQRCDQLPGARSIEDPDHRQAVASVWGVEPDSLPGRGLSYVEILQASASGRIGGLLALSTNPAVSGPDLASVRQALTRLDHLVVLDPFLSETAELADVVLPGATFAEEEGTITTLEGRVVRVDAAVAPLPGRGDIDILRNLANRLGSGRHFSFVSGRGVFEELRRATAGAPADYSGMTWEAIRDRGGIFWPCPHEGHEGTPRLFLDRFAHPDGRARFHPVVPASPPVLTDDDYPLVLTTGRVLAHYLSGNQTRRIPEQAAKEPECVLEVHPSTASSLGLRADQHAVLETRQGSVEVAWRENPGLRTDTVFLPYHWPVANMLTAADLDPVARIPGFKYTPVRISPAFRDMVQAIAGKTSREAQAGTSR